MAGPLPLPIRVLVKGASTVVFLAEWGGPRTDFNFGRVVEAELLSTGRPADVRVVGVPSDLAKFSLRTWERDVLGWSPDVIVLHHGHYESIHYVMPRWLERYANSTRWRPGGRVRTLYRKKIVRAVWITLASLQARADKRFNSTLFERRLRRVGADVQQLIEHVQTVASPLVLVLEVVPPGQRWWSWMPGLTERTAVMNDALAEAVARVDKPNVRFIRTSGVLADRLGPDEEPTPDGGHYSARAHRVIGETLAAEIVEWAKTQPHLQSAAAKRPRSVTRTDRVS
jgi:lysophospholipase L1-like esterase